MSLSELSCGECATYCLANIHQYFGLIAMSWIRAVRVENDRIFNALPQRAVDFGSKLFAAKRFHESIPTFGLKPKGTGHGQDFATLQLTKCRSMA